MGNGKTITTYEPKDLDQYLRKIGHESKLAERDAYRESLVQQSRRLFWLLGIVAVLGLLCFNSLVGFILYKEASLMDSKASGSASVIIFEVMRHWPSLIWAIVIVFLGVVATIAGAIISNHRAMVRFNENC